MFSKVLRHVYNKRIIAKLHNASHFLSTTPLRAAIHQAPHLKNSLLRITLQHHPLRSELIKRWFANTRMPKTPDLIYIPQLTRWLKTKFQLRKLQKTWDPEFSEGGFIFGTTKAVCRITEIIHENKPEDLNGLLTTSAKIKLLDDMSGRLTKTQKKMIRIRPEDIKILVPTTVHLTTDGDKKNCRVGMRVLALKWIQQTNGALRLVLIVLQTEFLKYYTDSATPDWTISAFDILECAILTQTPH